MSKDTTFSKIPQVKCKSKISFIEKPLSELSFGELLRHALRLSGRSRYWLAERLYISVNTLDNYLYDSAYQNVSLERFLDCARYTCPDLFAEWVRAKATETEATPEEVSFDALAWMGEALKDLSDALRDGVITQEEKARLKPIIIKLQEQLTTLLQSFEKEG